MGKATDIGRAAAGRGLSDEELLSAGREVLRVERDAVDALAGRVDAGFVQGGPSDRGVAGNA